MKLYAAGLFSIKMHGKLESGAAHGGQTVVKQLGNILESYHYIKKQAYVDDIRAAGRKVFLDSGAYSARSMGATISIADYCRYIKENEDIIYRDGDTLMAAALDDIGNDLGTYRNQLEMEARGVKAIPTFHQGEDERYLDYYIRNYEYISLGGMVGGNVKQLRIWLDRVFDRFIVDKSGHARLKVHGFGMTSYELMERYPWHSVDSATWGHAAQYGEIMSPEFGRLIVSDQSGALKTEGRHVDTLTEIEFNYVMKTLAAQGWNYDALQAKLEHRAAYNLNTYLIWERQINEKAGKFTPKVMELF